MLRTSVVAVAFAVATLSCGKRAPEAPSGVEGPAANELLGRRPDFAVALRLDRVRADPVYGPMLRENMSEKDFAAVFETVSAIDAIGAFDGETVHQVSLVGVMRSSPPLSKLPGAWRKAIEGNETRQLPSGVVEYVSLDKHGWPFGIYVAKNDWTLLAGRAAGPGHDWYSAHAAAPPPVEFGEGVLLGFWMTGAALQRPALAEQAKQPGSKGLLNAEMLLRDGQHGDLLYSASYETEADAKTAAHAWTDSIGMYASLWKRIREQCPPLAVLTYESSRDGREVHARVMHIPEALREIRSCK